MATSGTEGSTTFTTQQVIDHAYRRCKIPPELISGEKIDSALELLWLWLMEQASKGVPIWKIQTQLLPLYQGLGQVPALAGTVEILNANLRNMQRLLGTNSSNAGGTADLAFDSDLTTACIQTVANGSLIVNLGAATYITTIGLLPFATGTWSFVYEISTDGSTWTTVDTFTLEAVTSLTWIWNDYSITTPPDTFQYVRIRATGGTTLSVCEFYIAGIPASIPMAPLNKDDFFNLPNKQFQGRPVQYWQDVQRTVPVMNLWPVPNAAANFQLIEAQVHMRIQDVGDMTMELEIPDRWYNAAVWCLAENVADEDPDFKGDINRIASKAQEALQLAWGGIAAKGPIYISPNISPYTR